MNDYGITGTSRFYSSPSPPVSAGLTGLRLSVTLSRNVISGHGMRWRRLITALSAVSPMSRRAIALKRIAMFGSQSGLYSHVWSMVYSRRQSQICRRAGNRPFESLFLWPDLRLLYRFRIRP